MKTKADVVVIGAGIQGLSAAYHLAKIGITDVVVVEQEFIGAGASGRSASMLNLQVPTDWMVRFSLYCFDRFMNFEDEFGVDPGYYRIGKLELVTEEDADEMRDTVEMRRSLGVETEVWSPDEIKAHYPVIFTDDLVFGVYGAEGGNLEAQSIMLGYRDGARRLGVEVYQGVRAIGITHDGNRVSGVQTTQGEIATRTVVNAAGADAARVGEWVGIDLPMMPRLRNIYVTEAFPLIPDDTPFVEDVAGEWYYRKERPGVLIGMGKREADTAPMSIDWAYLSEILDVIVHRVPALGDAQIAKGWSGLRPLSADDRPIIGPVDGLEGYVNSCGWGGKGVMHSPIGGQLVAEWIHDGKTSTFDIEPFLFSRFQKSDA